MDYHMVKVVNVDSDSYDVISRDDHEEGKLIILFNGSMDDTEECCICLYLVVLSPGQVKMTQKLQNISLKTDVLGMRLSYCGRFVYSLTKFNKIQFLV